ncbi:MAG TPA: hypothetical protein VFD00_00660 [Thermoclostridium sp.]|nr:hypothetical protein [Thermoclostridium sp.]
MISKMKMESIVFDFIQMRVSEVSDIMAYGFTKSEAEEIQKEIFKR